MNSIEPDIRLGNIEESDIGLCKYDVIIALSTFEHVEHWQRGLRKIYDALKPGGLFYFYSTNRFSLRSGEFRMPFYGWLPDRWRYRIRVARSGEEILKLGIDFNQFNYFQLKSFFSDLGYEKIIDQFGIVGMGDLVQRRWCKAAILKLFKHIPSLRWLGLVFAGGNPSSYASRKGRSPNPRIYGVDDVVMRVAHGLLRPAPSGASAGLRRAGLAFAVLVSAMALTGGLVAGIRAGFAYNTWPLMNGQWVPAEILLIEPWWRNFG